MKRMLVLFGNEENTENLIKNSIYLRDKFNYKLSGLFISNIKAEAAIGAGVDGLNYDNSAKFMLAEEWINFEKEEVERVKKQLAEEKVDCTFSHEIGTVEEVISDYMKSFDVLVIGRGGMISDNLISVLKANYKGVFIIGSDLVDFSTLYIANDDGVKVNRTLYNFMNIFPELKEFTSVRINNGEENLLMKYLTEKEKKVHDKIEPNKDEVVHYLGHETTKGLLLMGNLSKSYFLERVTRKTGLKILENTKMTIFIG